MARVRGSFRIKNKLGLHARSAAEFVQLASQFTCTILVKKGNTESNGKSIMGVLQLAAIKGEVIEVVAEGKDGEAALKVLGKLIENRFGEEE